MSLNRQIVFLVVIGFGAFPLTVLTGMPVELRRCERSSDCVVVQATCLPDTAVHKRYADDVLAQYRTMAASIDCVATRPPDEKGVALKAECVKQLCETNRKQTAALATVKCEVFPKIATTQNDKLNASIALLQVPVAVSQSRALKELTTFGIEAVVVLPYLEVLWRRSLSNPYDSTGECLLGYADYKFAIINLLKKFGSKLAMPKYLIEFFHNKEKLRSHSGMEETFLQYLASIGESAAPLGSALVGELEESRSGSGYRRLHIEILEKLVSQKKISIPVLKKIASDPKDLESPIAVRALFALAPLSVLGGNVTIDALANPNQNQALTLEIVKALPNGCKNGPACVAALAELTKGGSFVLMIESVEALGRFGAAALPAADAVLKMYYGSSTSMDYEGKQYNTEKAPLQALLNIDPTGKSILPLVRPHLEDAFLVRKAVELLESFTGEPAKALAAEARRKWQLK